MKIKLIKAIVVVVLISTAGIATADVVSPEPETCPAGSTPSTCHGGPFCRPLPCEQDADCEGSATCQSLDLCIGNISCAGELPPDASPDDYIVDQVEGSCSGNGECTGGAECRQINVCAEAQTSSDSSGCSVATPGQGDRFPGGLFFALLLWVWGGLLIGRRR